MGCLKLTYYHQGEALEETSFFSRNALEKKGIAEKKRIDAYRYGFNGMERDDEMKGLGNSYDFMFRMYDSRLGKFLSVDPLAADYPWNSSYAFAENDVIRSIDLEGLEKWVVINIYNNGALTGRTVFSLLDNNGVEIKMNLKQNGILLTTQDVLILENRNGALTIPSQNREMPALTGDAFSINNNGTQQTTPGRTRTAQVILPNGTTGMADGEGTPTRQTGTYGPIPPITGSVSSSDAESSFINGRPGLLTTILNTANPATDMINISYPSDGWSQDGISDYLISEGLGSFNLSFTALPPADAGSSENASFSIVVQPAGQQLNIQ
jgi:RHS repeat-associated protein